MTNSNVQAYLNRHVLELLRQNAFDYLKIDYNDSMGVATDDAESGAEGLEKNISATLKFIDKLHHEIPGLVIENCSSGGHRLTQHLLSERNYPHFRMPTKHIAFQLLLLTSGLLFQLPKI